MNDVQKVTVLKRTENGKLKSLLVFNSAGEQARLFFSDDEKLTRMVVGNGSKNLVAFDRVGKKYVPDPLTPGRIDGFEEEANARWYCQGGQSEFWLYLKDQSGKTARNIDPETNKPYPSESGRCFINAWSSGMRFQSAQGYSVFQINFTPEGSFERFSGYSYGTYELIEQETANNTAETQATVSLVQKELDKRRSR